MNQKAMMKQIQQMQAAMATAQEELAGGGDRDATGFYPMG